jgi:acetyl-CoA synthetase
MIVKAFIVLNKGYEPSESLVRDIKNYVKRTTAPYKYPREIEFIAELPKTISGKIKRNELRAAEQKKTERRQIIPASSFFRASAPGRTGSHPVSWCIYKS